METVFILQLKCKMRTHRMLKGLVSKMTILSLYPTSCCFTNLLDFISTEEHRKLRVHEKIVNCWINCALSTIRIVNCWINCACNLLIWLTGAVGGSVPCSRVSPQSWYIPPSTIPLRTWDSNPRPLGYKSDSLSIRPRLPNQLIFLHIDLCNMLWFATYHCEII